MSLLFILLVFHSKYSQKSYLFIEVKLLKEKKLLTLNKYCAFFTTYTKGRFRDMVNPNNE